MAYLCTHRALVYSSVLCLSPYVFSFAPSVCVCDCVCGVRERLSFTEWTCYTLSANIHTPHIQSASPAAALRFWKKQKIVYVSVRFRSSNDPVVWCLLLRNNFFRSNLSVFNRIVFRNISIEFEFIICYFFLRLSRSAFLFWYFFFVFSETPCSHHDT